jgi:2,3-bisphosphoglycerate-dependent phosphoglycerate mutase
MTFGASRIGEYRVIYTQSSIETFVLKLLPSGIAARLMIKLSLTIAGCIFISCLCVAPLAAQNKTIILVRHAEKIDASQDPDLSAEGKTRAERLATIVKHYKPGAIYSTDFKRTRDTAAPLAARRKLQVQIYDAKKPAELIDAMMKRKTKRFLVVGHSNTIPGLANRLGKKELFKNLDDSEHGAIWVVRIKDGRVCKTEIIPY